MAVAAYHITPLTPLPVWLSKLLTTCHINILEVSFHLYCDVYSLTGKSIRMQSRYMHR